MNLLVSASPRSTECATAIEDTTQIRTSICSDIAKAKNLVRSGEYSAVIFDQATLDPDPSIADDILHNAGLAVPVFINSALMSSARITAEVRSAFVRIERERRLAQRQAEALLRNDVKGEITGILISAQLALSTPGLPHFIEDKIRDIEQLANRMRGRLEAIQ